jgi:CHAD domain-containing protein
VNRTDQGARLAELDARHRHKLRIKAKKLRYASEFFAAAFSGKKSTRRRKKFIARLKNLQASLGDLHDIVVHERLAERTVDAPAPSKGSNRRRANKAFAAGRLSGREEGRFMPVMKETEHTYAFAKATPFWN